MRANARNCRETVLVNQLEEQYIYDKSRRSY